MSREPTVCGVRVAAWGAEEDGHPSLKHTIDQKLFGGNCGHVAISLTIPATDENKALLKEYCSHPPIPLEKMLVRVPMAKQDNNGNWVPDYDSPPAFEEEVYIVTFSWWPGAGGFFLSPSINNDGYDERIGVHREWDARYREFIDVEDRIHKGILSGSKVSYSPVNIQHSRNLDFSSDQRRYLNLKTQKEIIESIKQSLDVTKDKIENKSKSLEEIKKRREKTLKKSDIIKQKKDDIALLKKIRRSVSSNKKLTLSSQEKKRIDEIYPGWRNNYKRDSKTNTQLNVTKHEMKKKIEQLKKEIKSVKKDNYKKTKRDENRILKLSETEIILLDRFLPNWRDKFNYQDRLSEELYQDILKEVIEIKNIRKKELDIINQEIYELDYVNYPEHLRDIGFEKKKIKEINEQVKKLRNKRKTFYSQIDETRPIKKYMSLHRFFYDNYLDDDSETCLQDGERININKKLRDKLDMFVNITNIELETIIHLPEDKELSSISKEEIELIDDILFNYVKKLETLSFFSQFLDPNSPEYLEDDEKLLISYEVRTFLRYSKQDSGLSWRKYFSNKSEISKEEIMNLVKTTQRYELQIDQAKPLTEKEYNNTIESLVNLRNLNAQIKKTKKKSKDLKREIKSLDQYKEMEKYLELSKIRKNINTWNYAYRLINYTINNNKDVVDNIELDDELIEELNDSYEIIEVNWQELFLSPPIFEPVSVDIETLKKIRDDLGIRLKESNLNVIDDLPVLDSFSSKDFESFLTMGLPPEIEYHLSLDATSDPNNGIEWGMNIEGMLKEMHQILVEDIPFDLNSNNCSVTASRILEAGANGEHLKSMFRNRALGEIATPQLVANNTEDFLKAYKDSPKDNIFKRIARWNPVEKSIGKQIRTILSSDSSFAQKSFAWIKAGAITILVSPLMVAKGLFSPADSFKRSLQLIRFSRNKNHIGFTAAAFVIGGLGMTFFSVPALLESCIKLPFRAVRGITHILEKRRIRKIVEHVDIPIEVVEERNIKETLYKENLAVAEDNLVIIKNKNPLEALNHAKLVSESNKIPMFEGKTLSRIQQYIESRPNQSEKEALAKELASITLQATETTKQVMKNQSLLNKYKGYTTPPIGNREQMDVPLEDNNISRVNRKQIIK